MRPNSVRLSRLCNKVLVTIALWVYAMPPLVGLVVCVKPALPDFWTSISPSTGLAVRVPMAAFQSYLVLVLCDTGVISMFSGIPMLFGGLDLLRIMRSGKILVLTVLSMDKLN